METLSSPEEVNRKVFISFVFWFFWGLFCIYFCFFCVAFLRVHVVPPPLLRVKNHFLVPTGGYRFFYILNWIYRYFVEGKGYWVSWMAGIVQTLLYADFFYHYLTKYVICMILLCSTVTIVVGVQTPFNCNAWYCSVEGKWRENVCLPFQGDIQGNLANFMNILHPGQWVVFRSLRDACGFCQCSPSRGVSRFGPSSPLIWAASGGNFKAAWMGKGPKKSIIRFWLPEALQSTVTEAPRSLSFR